MTGKNISQRQGVKSAACAQNSQAHVLTMKGSCQRRQEALFWNLKRENTSKFGPVGTSAHISLLSSPKCLQTSPSGPRWSKIDFKYCFLATTFFSRCQRTSLRDKKNPSWHWHWSALYDVTMSIHNSTKSLILACSTPMLPSGFLIRLLEKMEGPTKHTFQPFFHCRRSQTED